MEKNVIEQDVPGAADMGNLREAVCVYPHLFLGKALRMLLDSYVDSTLPQGITAELPTYEESRQVDNEH